MTPEQRAALDALVPPEQQTGDARTDLIAAVNETMRRRRENSRLGGAVIAALYNELGSWLAIERVTKEAGHMLGRHAAQRWGKRPPFRTNTD